MGRSSRVLWELLRLPNLFTVPGDVLVGWCLAGQRGGIPVLGIVASLCLYAAGLLLNDVCDAAVDARERPERPIPSGRVSRRTVFAWALSLSLAGLVLAGSGIGMAGILLALIVAYDGGFKRIPGVGVLTMGACRGVNVLLGAAVSWPMGEMPRGGGVAAAAIFFAAYIVLVSVVAKNEAQPGAQVGGKMRTLPLLMTLALLPLFWWFGRAPVWPVVPVALLLVPTLLARKGVPALVSGLIRHLIPLQLLWCLVGLPQDAVLIPTFLVFCWVGALFASRRYSGS